MAVNDLYQVKTEASMFEERIENVWYYRQSGSFAGNAAQALSDAFQAVVLAAIAQLQVQAVSYIRVVVRNLFTPSENFEDLSPVPAGGVLVTAAAPPLLAYSFRSVRPDLSKRYSYKRFAGVDITQISGENWNQFAAADALAVRNAMTAELSPGFGSFVPVQVKVVKAPLLPPVYTENYRIVGWDAQQKLTTQNTRKHGRGI